MVDELYSLTARGLLARGIEMQLVGLAEPDSSCVLAGLRDVMIAAQTVTRSPDEIAAEVAQEEEAPQAVSSRSYLTVIRGGWEEPPMIETSEAPCST